MLRMFGDGLQMRGYLLGSFFVYCVGGVFATRGRSLSTLEEGVFGNLWKSPTPLKVVAFSWSLLLDRIPT